jgi:hypothetical protein
VVFHERAVIGRYFHKAFPLTGRARLRGLLFKEISFRFVIFRQFWHDAPRWNNTSPDKRKAFHQGSNLLLLTKQKEQREDGYIWKKIP